MARSTRFALIAVAAVILLILLVGVSLPLFLNANNFRSRIETTLSQSLGRKVTIGNLSLSVWSGGLAAENTTVADDPKFSSQPFIQTDSVKIGVELLPLLFRREVHVRGFTLQSPKIQLLRAANGTWNYSTIGSAANAPTAQGAQTKQIFPNLTVGHVDINDGQITVGIAPANGAVSQPKRVYQQVNLDVKNFGFANSFPFTASAQLPAEGSVKISGTAGPINPQDASATPFSGHLEIKHLDPLAAGFVDVSDGISGLIQDIVLDASWNGQQMHVSKLLIEKPNLTILRSNVPKQPKPAGANPEGSTMLQNLSVDDAQIKDGTVTLTTAAGQTTSPAVYQQVNLQITNLTPTSSSPFNASAQLPGGGSLSANGKAGPFNQANNASTPVNAQVSLKHASLGTSGVLPPDAGIGGIADLQAQIQSDGQTLNATGTGSVAGIKLAKDGQPSTKPVQMQFALSQNEQAMTGQIRQATITVGRAVINVAGTFQSSGPTTALDLKVNGNAVPIDEIVAFLPAMGVHLPQNSRLQGGTLTTSLTVSGSTANPIISGPVRLDNTQLAGFDLGSKLQGLSRLTGGRIGGATGSGTTIHSLSMNVYQANGAIRTDKIALDVAGIGTATGAGSVSQSGALNYNMLLKLTGLVAGPANTRAASTSGGGVGGLAGGLAGLISGGGGAASGIGSIGGLAGGVLKNGVPVAIGGTTSNPTFMPNLAGAASGMGAGAAQNLLNHRSNGSPTKGSSSDSLTNALGGLLGKH